MTRRTLSTFVSTLALTSIFLTAGATAIADDGTSGEEKLPASPAPPASVPNFGTTTRSDGTPIAVVVAGGDGGMLNIVDLNKGTSTAKEFAPAGTDIQAWGFATMNDADKTVLIGAGKGLYQYNPRTDAVTNLSAHASYNSVKGSFNQIWDIAIDESGTAYIATSADGSAPILTWTASKGWGTLSGAAPVAQGTQYAQAIDYAGGKVYVGTGPQNPRVYEIDVRSGAKKEIALPAPARGNGTYQNLEVHGGILYVRNLGETGTTAYNLSNGQSDNLSGYVGHFVPRPGNDSSIYFWHKGASTPAQILEYNPVTKEKTVVLESDDILGRLSPASWATPDIFVSNDMNSGQLTIARGKNVTKHNDLVKAAARDIQALTASDNGKLYASWYMTTPGVLQVTPGNSAASTSYTILEAPIGQAEGMAAKGDHLVTGLYPGGKVGSRSVASASAPTQTVSIGAGQDRPYAVIPLSDGRYALGSVPGYGNLGGALTIYDPRKGEATDAAQVFPFDSLKYANGVDQGLLKDLSPVSLAERNGKIYMGTSVRGGHGMKASPQQAYIVEFDVASQSVTRIVKAFDGQAAVTALTVGDDGVLYGTTGQYLFKMDKNYTVTGQSLSPGGAVAHNRAGIVYEDGEVFALIAGTLYAAPASDLSAAKVIADRYINSLALGADGYLYYSRGAELFRNGYAKR